MIADFHGKGYAVFSSSNAEQVSYGHLDKPISIFTDFLCEAFENKLLVNYSVEPVGKFRIAWVKYFPPILLIMFNYLFLYIVIPPKEVHITFNIIIVLMTILSAWLLQRQKKDYE